MPIRFRCAYCNQLMGIARRKSGTVVRCPKCSGQVVVPATSETGSLTPYPSSTTTQESGGQTPSAPASLFEFGDEAVAARSGPTAEEPLDVVPLSGAAPLSGVFLTVRHLLAAGVLIVVMLVSSFFLGWFLRGR